MAYCVLYWICPRARKVSSSYVLHAFSGVLRLLHENSKQTHTYTHAHHHIRTYVSIHHHYSIHMYKHTYVHTHHHCSQCTVYDSCKGKPQNSAGWRLVGCGGEGDMSGWLSGTQVAQSHHLHTSMGAVEEAYNEWQTPHTTTTAFCGMMLFFSVCMYTCTHMCYVHFAHKYIR